MGASRLANIWILMLVAGIIIQAVVYPLTWLFQLFVHDFFNEVFVICIISVIIQTIGFLIIIMKTRDQDPKIYSQGRPFRHKLREEDTEVATRKPTY